VAKLLNPTSSGVGFFHRCSIVFLISALCVLSGRSAWALRIVSLLPSNTEILESLGAGDDIVGVTRFDAPNPRRTVVGDFIHPNLETIVALKPDLIVAGYWASSRAVPRLRKLGYQVLDIRNPRSLDDLYGTIRTIAGAIGRSQSAASVVADMKRKLSRLGEASRRFHRNRRAYIEVDPGLWTVGGPDFLTQALHEIGIDNIYSDIPKESCQVSAESVVERNPDVILLLHGKRQELVKRPGWSLIRAVRLGWVIDDINPDRLARPSPRMTEGLEQLERKMETTVGPSHETR
jgi:iron complex transport system substrate-binding protein